MIDLYASDQDLCPPPPVSKRDLMTNINVIVSPFHIELCLQFAVRLFLNGGFRAWIKESIITDKNI